MKDQGCCWESNVWENPACIYWCLWKENLKGQVAVWNVNKIVYDRV